MTIIHVEFSDVYADFSFRKSLNVALMETARLSFDFSDIYADFKLLETTKPGLLDFYARSD